MKQLYIFLALFVGIAGVKAQTNPTPQTLPYSQNFASFNGSASAYPAGWQGWTITGSTAATYPTAVPAADQVLASGTTSQNSAVSAFVGDAVNKIAFLNTSSAIKCFALAINTTGFSNVPVSYLAATQRQQVANRIGGMGLQYRVGTSNTFTDVPLSEYVNPGGTDNVVGTTAVGPQTISVTLPAACDNQPVVQLRWVYREVSGGGNRPGFSVTNVVIGSAGTPASVTAGTLVDFGSITVGNNSASQTFNISGTNLNGAPGNLSVTSPSTDFQVSNDNSTWSSSTTIAYTSATLATTPVYARFTPQTAGIKTGNISITGGGLSSAVTVAVSGTGTAPITPTLTTSALTAFGSSCTNVAAGPNSFTVNGINLTNTNITVAALTGYTYSTTAGGSYTASLNLPQTGGTYSQTIYVKFTPTAIQTYNGNIAVNGGGIPAAVNVAASGAGVNLAPAVTTGAASSVTTTTATLAGSITSTGCTNVTAYGVEYSLVNGFANGSGTNVPSTNLSAGNFSVALSLLTATTTYYFKAYATNGAGTTYGAQQSFTTASPPPPSLSVTGITGFGSLCVNGTAGPNTFIITGANLTAANVTVAAAAGFTYSTTAAGTYSSTLSFTQPGGSFNQIVYVKFTPTTANAYNAIIAVGGGGTSAPVNAVATGTGINTPPSVTTGTAAGINRNGATLAGTITANGCTAASSYGIEYSPISGFADGNGTKSAATGISANNFTLALTGLVQNSTYYYKAYAINSGGVAYGTQQTFKTTAISAGLHIYSTPVQRGNWLYYSITGLKPAHYSVKLFNSNGQFVYDKELIVQVDFIDERLMLPASLKPGIYNLQIVSVYGFMENRKFMVF